MTTLTPRTAVLVAVISGVLGGGGTVALVNAVTTRDERAQRLEFQEFDRLIAEIERQDRRIEAQDTRIQAQDDRLAGLRTDVRVLSASLVESAQEITRLNARVAELEAELLARDAIISRLREQIEELRSELESLR